MIHINIGLDNPESLAIYTNANELVEKWVPIAAVTISKITPGALLLPNLVTVFLAYTRHGYVDAEIYRMAFPTWYVFAGL